MLGLDAAGKTTILYKLHIGEILSTVPTIGEEMERGGGGRREESEGGVSLFKSYLHLTRLLSDSLSLSQVSTWRRCSTRTSCSRCGTGAAR